MPRPRRNAITLTYDKAADKLVTTVDTGAPGCAFTLTYPNGTTTTLRVGSNGIVFATSVTTTDFSPSVAELLAGGQRWCPMWRDLNPSSGGTVHFDVDPSNNAVFVTFANVPNFGLTVPNNFQIAFFNTGVVEYRYRDIDIAGATIVGHTSGAIGTTPATDPGNIDISVQAAAANPRDRPTLCAFVRRTRPEGYRRLRTAPARPATVPGPWSRSGRGPGRTPPACP